jgi:hypothetical protein
MLSPSLSHRFAKHGINNRPWPPAPANVNGLSVSGSISYVYLSYDRVSNEARHHMKTFNGSISEREETVVVFAVAVD